MGRIEHSCILTSTVLSMLDWAMSSMDETIHNYVLIDSIYFTGHDQAFKDASKTRKIQAHWVAGTIFFARGECHSTVLALGLGPSRACTSANRWRLQPTFHGHPCNGNKLGQSSSLCLSCIDQ